MTGTKGIKSDPNVHDAVAKDHQGEYTHCVTFPLHFLSVVMAAVATMPSVSKPTSMKRPTHWSEEVEEAYRFQIAGYRDEREYLEVQKRDHVDRWPHNGYVKKLVRKDGCFYYYNKTRECPDKEINKTKLYAY